MANDRSLIIETHSCSVHKWISIRWCQMSSCLSMYILSQWTNLNEDKWEKKWGYEIINGRISKKEEVFDKFSNRLNLNKSSIWRNSEFEPVGGGGEFKLTTRSTFPLPPKSFDKNECDKYKIDHMFSFWKNFERRWVSVSYDTKASRMIRCD